MEEKEKKVNGTVNRGFTIRIDGLAEMKESLDMFHGMLSDILEIMFRIDKFMIDLSKRDRG